MGCKNLWATPVDFKPCSCCKDMIFPRIQTLWEESHLQSQYHLGRVKNNPQEFPLARSNSLFCHCGITLLTDLNTQKYFMGFQRIIWILTFKCVVNIPAFNNFYLFERKERCWKWTNVLEALHFWRKNKMFNFAGGNWCCFSVENWTFLVALKSRRKHSMDYI